MTQTVITISFVCCSHHHITDYRGLSRWTMMDWVHKSVIPHLSGVWSCFDWCLARGVSDLGDALILLSVITRLQNTNRTFCSSVTNWQPCLIETREMHNTQIMFFIKYQMTNGWYITNMLYSLYFTSQRIRIARKKHNQKGNDKENNVFVFFIVFLDWVGLTMSWTSNNASNVCCTGSKRCLLMQDERLFCLFNIMGWVKSRRLKKEEKYIGLHYIMSVFSGYRIFSELLT